RGFARQFEKSLDTAREKTAPTRHERNSAGESISNPITPSRGLLLAAYRGANHELAGQAPLRVPHPRLSSLAALGVRPLPAQAAEPPFTNVTAAAGLVDHTDGASFAQRRHLSARKRNTCAHANDGAPCDDGVFCNGADTCAGGKCSVHAGNPCPGPDGDSNCKESCDERTHSCTANDPNGSFCNDGRSCNGADSCQNGVCVGSGVCCGTVNFTFTVKSNRGGALTSAEWPGGTQSQTSSAGCSVTINNPDDNIDKVCTLADPFSVRSFTGFQNCVGNGGEDGDGCDPVSCPPAGIGSCCSGRPSCSAALNGSGSARFFVHCVDP